MARMIEDANKVFQSTHPVRGATHQQHGHGQAAVISIHAPREGCDMVSFRRIQLPIAFQSTHPVRGATQL